MWMNQGLSNPNPNEPDPFKDFGKTFNRVSGLAVALGLVAAVAGLALAGTVIYAIITLVNKV